MKRSTMSLYILGIIISLGFNARASVAFVDCLSKNYEEISFEFEVSEVHDKRRSKKSTKSLIDLRVRTLVIAGNEAIVENQYFNGHILNIFALENNPLNMYPSNFQFVLNPHEKFFSIKLYDFGHFPGQEPIIEEELQCHNPRF